MLIACWSTKGGSGTTVVAASLGLLLARRHPSGALLVDLAGDLPAALGLPTLAADAPAEVDVGGGLSVATVPAGGAEGLVERLRAERRAVVVDCGRLGAGAPPVADAVAGDVLAAADRSLLVLRPCYLALRRATASSHRPTGVVLVSEPGRAITAADVADSLGVPVVAEVPVTEAIARAVDAGLLATRVPRSLLRDLAGAA